MFFTYKPQGQTLGQLTNNLREKINKKICYVGRLDPLAYGLVCFLVEDECKNQKEYIRHDKTYSFNIIFGISTDSGDPLGKILDIKDVFEIDYKKIEAFDGYKYLQEYPLYSSYVIKKDGLKKPLWYFEKNGIKLDEIPSHEIIIKKLDISGNPYFINNSDYFIKQIEKLDDCKADSFRRDEILEQYKKIGNFHFLAIPMVAKVSSGTYIRKLCEDIGASMGIPAIADNIERISFHFPEKIENYDFL